MVAPNCAGGKVRGMAALEVTGGVGVSRGKQELAVPGAPGNHPGGSGEVNQPVGPSPRGGPLAFHALHTMVSGLNNGERGGS